MRAFALIPSGSVAYAFQKLLVVNDSTELFDAAYRNVSFGRCDQPIKTTIVNIFFKLLVPRVPKDVVEA